MTKPSIEELAKRISIDLFNSRKKGNSNPESPVKSETICTAYHAQYHWNIDDRDIRAACYFLVENEVPIGSTLQGYYYVLKSDEWQFTKDMLLPKFLSMKKKIDSINKMEKEMAQKEDGQTEIFRTLDQQLGLEKVA